jgi:sialate O-acetylesterase
MTTPSHLPATHLAPLFTDHMVLQSGRSNPIWGWDRPEQRVTLHIEGAPTPVPEVVVTARSDGTFRIACPALPVGGPYRLRMRGSRECVLEDVLVGEVWLASGQSNMEWKVAVSADGSLEIAEAVWPQIRMFTVDQQAAREPRAVVGGKWRPCSPETAGDFSAVGYYFARGVHQNLSVPIGIIDASWGGTRVEAWTSIDALRETMDVDAAVEHRIVLVSRNVFATCPSMPDALSPQNAPAALFHGMIAPLVPFGLRGVIWYQGESNVDDHVHYRDRLLSLVRDWRSRWGAEDAALHRLERGCLPRELPFYVVQLANFVASPAWAYLREAQAQALSEPATGIAVTIDIGDPDDIHPRNKQEVGRRLALLALARTYGRVDLEWSGPWLDRVEIDRGEARVWFRHAAGLRARGGGPVRGFALAGADRLYHRAEGRIDGDSVVLKSGDVPVPVAMRYAWADNPDANLENAASLPAAPFRTDRW